MTILHLIFNSAIIFCWNMYCEWMCSRVMCSLGYWRGWGGWEVAHGCAHLICAHSVTEGVEGDEGLVMDVLTCHILTGLLPREGDGLLMDVLTWYVLTRLLPREGCSWMCSRVICTHWVTAPWGWGVAHGCAHMSWLNLLLPREGEGFADNEKVLCIDIRSI